MAISKTNGLSLDGLVGLKVNSLRTVSPLRNDRTGFVTEQMSFETPFSLTTFITNGLENKRPQTASSNGLRHLNNSPTRSLAG